MAAISAIINNAGCQVARWRYVYHRRCRQQTRQIHVAGMRRVEALKRVKIESSPSSKKKKINAMMRDCTVTRRGPYGDRIGYFLRRRIVLVPVACLQECVLFGARARSVAVEPATFLNERYVCVLLFLSPGLPSRRPAAWIRTKKLLPLLMPTRGGMCVLFVFPSRMIQYSKTSAAVVRAGRISLEDLKKVANEFGDAISGEIKCGHVQRRLYHNIINSSQHGDANILCAASSCHSAFFRVSELCISTAF